MTQNIFNLNFKQLILVDRFMTIPNNKTHKTMTNLAQSKIYKMKKLKWHQITITIIISVIVLGELVYLTGRYLF